MRKIITTVLMIGFTFFGYAQHITSINSGAISNNNLTHAIGEVFVISENGKNAHSGIISIISRVELLTLDIDEVKSSNTMKFYPNPTSNSIYLETNNLIIENVWIYDQVGRLVMTKKVINKKIDMKDLIEGIYLIKLNNYNNQSFRIIKK